MREKDTSFDIATVLEAQKWDAEKMPVCRHCGPATEARAWVDALPVDQRLEIRRYLQTSTGSRWQPPGTSTRRIRPRSAMSSPWRRHPRGGQRTGWPGMIRAFQLGNPSSSDGVTAVPPAIAWTRASVGRSAVRGVPDEPGFVDRCRGAAGGGGRGDAVGVPPAAGHAATPWACASSGVGAAGGAGLRCRGGWAECAPRAAGGPGRCGMTNEEMMLDRLTGGASEATPTVARASRRGGSTPLTSIFRNGRTVIFGLLLVDLLRVRVVWWAGVDSGSAWSAGAPVLVVRVRWWVRGRASARSRACAVVIVVGPGPGRGRCAGSRRRAVRTSRPAMARIRSRSRLGS